MKELTLETLIAVFEEIFGKGLFWLMIVLFALITAAFIYVLVRDRKLTAHRWLRAELLAPVGAFLGIAFVFAVTNSGLSDIGGPIDVIVLILIGAAGGIGLTIFTYTLQALVFNKTS